jgi:hypothetical protein
MNFNNKSYSMEIDICVEFLDSAQQLLGCMVASLRHSATSRKVAGSNSDKVDAQTQSPMLQSGSQHLGLLIRKPVGWLLDHEGDSQLVPENRLRPLPFSFFIICKSHPRFNIRPDNFAVEYPEA